MDRALRHLSDADPVMCGLIAQVGRYSIEYSPADFATFAYCIVNQQLSGKAAVTIYNRLEGAASKGRRMTPEDVLRLRPDRMRALGLSQQKVRYIREVARQFRAGKVDMEALAARSDAEVLKHLTRIKGVGPWTVHMLLIFCLGRLDVLPTGDLGIRVAVRNVYDLPETPPPGEVERIATPWRPYATVATWYLWRSLGDGDGLMP